MKNGTNYGKIIAITLSIVTSACAIAFVIYRLFRNLIEFCNTYQLPEEEDALDLCELEEGLFEEDDAEACTGEELADDVVEPVAE